MTLATADLVWYYTGVATGVSDATASLGGTISANTIESGLSNNVFDDVTGAEALASESHYRVIALKNTSVTNKFLNFMVWINGYTRAASGADTIYFGIERATIGAAGTSIQVIANELTAPDTVYFNTAPSGVYWVPEGSPSETVTPLVNTLEPGSLECWVGIWLWRTIPTAASAYTSRSCTIKVQGETTGSPRMIIQKTYSINWIEDGRISVYEV